MSTAAHTRTDVILTVTDYPDPPLANLVHPRPVSWDSVFQGISGALPTPLPLIPFAQWLAKVEQASQDSSTNNFEKIVSEPSHHQIIVPSKVLTDILARDQAAQVLECDWFF